jgi:hypothetical protein
MVWEWQSENTLKGIAGHSKTIWERKIAGADRERSRELSYPYPITKIGLAPSLNLWQLSWEHHHHQ